MDKACHDRTQIHGNSSSECFKYAKKEQIKLKDMNKKRIVAVLGTRPQFIEMAPIIHALNKFNDVELLIYNTGQHYDRLMSEIFFDELSIPEPDTNFEVAADSVSHAEQTGMIMIKAEKSLLSDKPDIVVVEGDTNTTLAVALAASKLKLKVAHIEAGGRCFDKTLPEELNRVLLADLADIHYAPVESHKKNLLHEGVDNSAIHVLGHPVVDSIAIVSSRLKERFPSEKMELGNYFYVTLHRDFNVDNPLKLQSILKDLSELAEKRTVVFPIHPRTQKCIQEFGLSDSLHNITTMRPIGYVESLSLIKHAYAVISDSGGLLKESMVFGTPMITLRPNTEWPEVAQGFANQLAFARGNSITKCVQLLTRNYDVAKVSMKKFSTYLGTPNKVASNIASHMRSIL